MATPWLPAGDGWPVHGPLAAARPLPADEREHEVRAALFGIEASAQALNRHRHLLGGFEFDALADGLIAEVQRVKALVGGQVEGLSTFDLADAVASAVTMARARGLAVRGASRRRLPVSGRRDDAVEVLVILLDNAGRHAPGSAVDVRAGGHGRWVWLAVEDRGGGIAPELVPALFERGVKGADSEGSGLGLSIARRLMDGQGGTIHHRHRPGGGATFVVTFRRATERPPIGGGAP